MHGNQLASTPAVLNGTLFAAEGICRINCAKIMLVHPCSTDETNMTAEAESRGSEYATLTMARHGLLNPHPDPDDQGPTAHALPYPKIVLLAERGLFRPDRHRDLLIIEPTHRPLLLPSHWRWGSRWGCLLLPAESPPALLLLRCLHYLRNSGPLDFDRRCGG